MQKKLRKVKDKLIKISKNVQFYKTQSDSRIEAGTGVKAMGQSGPDRRSAVHSRFLNLAGQDIAIFLNVLNSLN